jgi:acetyl-CoA C-acetyltransferase
MSVRGKAYIVGAYEHPGRLLPDRSEAQIHAEVAVGALKDAGLSMSDADGFFMSSGSGLRIISLADYLGLQPSYLDSTYTGGSSPVYHVGHAAAAIAMGLCNVALVTSACRARSGQGRSRSRQPEDDFEMLFGTSDLGMYALAAQRHMYEFGTTSAQLAEVKVAASHHAQYNPHALLPRKVTVEDVLNSPMLSDPLHRMDACVVTDSGGAVVVVSPEIARDLPRPAAKILGRGEAPKHTMNGRVNLTYTGARWSGPRAFQEAGLQPSDINYASIYDSFTITVIETIEDLGFCAKGEGGRFVMDGALHAPHGKLPFNTDGGGLCNNHPAMGGITKIIEAVRQVRGEANPEVQVANCELVLAHGTGGQLGTRMGSATLILGNSDA